MWEKPNGQYLVDPLSLNHYTYCHNNPVLYGDPNGLWIHVLVGAVVGAILGAALEIASQVAAPGGSWDIDWGLVAINGFFGAVNGAFTATGVGGAATGAFIGGLQSMCEQAYTKGTENIDLIEVGVSAGFGAATGFIGNVYGKVFPFPQIPQKHFFTMSESFFKQIGDAVKYHLGKGARKEIMNALEYYFSQMATLMWRTVIRTLLIEMPRDEVIEMIYKESGLSQAAIEEVHSFILSESGGE